MSTCADTAPHTHQQHQTAAPDSRTKSHDHRTHLALDAAEVQARELAPVQLLAPVGKREGDGLPSRWRGAGRPW